MKKIECWENTISHEKELIKDSHASIHELETELIAYRGELELLMHPDDLEDLPEIWVDIPPKPRKWWQVWKPKEIPKARILL